MSSTHVGAERGDYSDSVEKGNTNVLYLAEVFGALSASCHRLVHLSNKLVRSKGAHDNTDYGNRAKRLQHDPKGFEIFHKRRLAAAAVFGWARALCRGARVRRTNLHLDDPSDDDDDSSYGVLGNVEPTPHAGTGG